MQQDDVLLSLLFSCCYVKKCYNLPDSFCKVCILPSSNCKVCILPVSILRCLYSYNMDPRSMMLWCYSEIYPQLNGIWSLMVFQVEHLSTVLPTNRRMIAFAYNSLFTPLRWSGFWATLVLTAEIASYLFRLRGKTRSQNSCNVNFEPCRGCRTSAYRMLIYHMLVQRRAAQRGAKTVIRVLLGSLLNKI